MLNMPSFLISHKDTKINFLTKSLITTTIFAITVSPSLASNGPQILKANDVNPAPAIKCIDKQTVYSCKASVKYYLKIAQTSKNLPTDKACAIVIGEGVSTKMLGYLTEDNENLSKGNALLYAVLNHNCPNDMKDLAQDMMNH
jgi:hypothetical protein